MFDAPFTFRADRSPTGTSASATARNACLGMSLAKVELQYLFRELLARVDSFELPASRPGCRPRSSAVSSACRLRVRPQ
jgi:cytochrome P450